MTAFVGIRSLIVCVFSLGLITWADPDAVNLDVWAESVSNGDDILCKIQQDDDFFAAFSTNGFVRVEQRFMLGERGGAPKPYVTLLSFENADGETVTTAGGSVERSNRVIQEGRSILGLKSNTLLVNVSDQELHDLVVSISVLKGEEAMSVGVGAVREEVDFDYTAKCRKST